MNEKCRKGKFYFILNCKKKSTFICLYIFVLWISLLNIYSFPDLIDILTYFIRKLSMTSYMYDAHTPF